MEIYIIGEMNDKTVTYFHPSEGRFIAGVGCVCSEKDFDRAINIAAVDYPLLKVYKKPVDEK